MDIKFVRHFRRTGSQACWRTVKTTFGKVYFRTTRQNKNKQNKHGASWVWQAAPEPYSSRVASCAARQSAGQSKGQKWSRVDRQVEEKGGSPLLYCDLGLRGIKPRMAWLGVRIHSMTCNSQLMTAPRNAWTALTKQWSHMTSCFTTTSFRFDGLMLMASNSTCMKKYLLFKLLYNISNMCYLYSTCCVCYSINSFLETERGKTIMENLPWQTIFPYF